MRAARHRRPRVGRPWLRQVLTGLVAIPVSALPFVGYTAWTSEGRLVLNRLVVALHPPSLPTLTPPTAAAAAAAAPSYNGAVMALAYHGIGSASDAEGGFVISPKRFGEHLATLRAAGMRTVTAAQVVRAADGGTQLPPKAVMISFDDGRTDAMLFADPLLEQARMRATMFVITGAAEKPGIYYASWDKLEHYARSGRWDIESHSATLHHDQAAEGGVRLPALTSLVPGETLTRYRARVRADLAEASTAIERHVGQKPVAFAYPFGAYGAERANDPRIRQVLREEVSRRYAVAFHQDDQKTVPLVRPDDDRLGLRRLEVGNWSGLELVKRIAAAARRTASLDDVPAATPEPLPPIQADGPPPALTATTAMTAADGTATSAPVPRRTSPSTSVPRRTGIPTTASPGSTLPPPPPARPSTTSPSPTTVPPPTTSTTSTTSTTLRPITPTTTSIPVPTTTTSVPDSGCRSHGQGSVCHPKGG